MINSSINIPPFHPCREFCLHLLSGISPKSLSETIQDYQRSQGQILPGFSGSLKSLQRPTVLNRLAQQMSHHDNAFAILLLAHPDAPWKDVSTALAVLDEAWLGKNWRRLVEALPQGKTIALALLIDQRRKIQRCGLRLSACPSFWQTTEKTNSDLPPDWLALQKITGGEKTPDVRKKTKKKEQSTQKQNHDLERQRERVKQAEKRLRETEEQTRQKIETIKKKAQQDRRRARELETEIDTLREEFETRLFAETVDLQEKLLGGKLPPATNLEKENQETDIYGRAEKLLEQQSKIDRAAGTRSALRQEIKKLTTLHEEIGKVGSDSISPLPELGELMTEIAHKIQSLKAQLKDYIDDTETPDLLSNLRFRIKSTQLDNRGRNELRTINDFLEQDIVRQLLGATSLDELKTLCQTREKQITSLQKMRDQREKLPRHSREIWDIARRLQTTPAKDVWLYIDAYNAILRNPLLFGLQEETSGDLSVAREEFCKLCRQRAPLFGLCELVFDGQGTLTTVEEGDAMRIVFPRQDAESQNADNYIIEQLAANRPKAPTIWLVTDDFGLRQRAETTCDGFISTKHLLQFLGK